MGKQLRNNPVELMAIVVNGQIIDKAESAEYSINADVKDLRAGGELYPYHTETFGYTIEGTITFRHFDAAVAQQLFGGTLLTSGIQWTLEETKTVAAITPLGNAATATPLQSGHVVVKSADGTKVFLESKTGTPGTGEFSYLTASSLSFNAGDVGSSVKVSYGVFSASGNGWDSTSTATANDVRVTLIPKSKSLDTNNYVYPAVEFPKARFTSFSDSMQVGDFGSKTIGFRAVADSNGRAIRFFTASG